MNHPLSIAAVLLLSSILPAQGARPAAVAGPPASTSRGSTASAADGEVPIAGAAGGFTAWLIHQGDAGVWYAHVAKAVPQFGPPEVIVTDDKGRLVVLTVYSGKWTANVVTPDGQWLAPSRPADVDPRVPGTEVYAAGKGGSVHQVVLQREPFAKFTLRSREIGHAAGEEFHTLLAADLDPRSPGDELLAFGITGAVWQLRAGSDGDAFAMQRAAQLPGRVRDAVVVPDAAGAAGAAGGPAEIFAVSRSGDLLRLRLTERGLQHEVLLHEDSGLGRIARRSPTNSGVDAGSEVFYVTRDDGLLLRVVCARGGGCSREPIFAGPQGLRGVAAGRFCDDPARECVATYGYGRTVHLVSRTGDGPWQAEVIYRGEQQGHWLAVGELDGRNGTDELVATGFDGKVILLARPPGYALPGAAVEPQRAPAAGAPTAVAGGGR